MTAAMPPSLPDRADDAPVRPVRDDAALDAAAMDDVALDWFVRRRGPGTPADDAAFTAWLEQDPAHRAAYERHEQDWDALDALPAAGIAQLRADLNRDLQAEQRSSRRASTRAATQAPSTRAHSAGWRAWLMQGTFAFALVLACGGGYLAWDHWQRQPVFTQQFASARGQQLDITLPDGSRLRLDTATRAEVTLYRTRREVRLPEGQAVFQVQNDATRPFDVLAGPLRVTVIGTRFSVRHTPGMTQDGGVRVAVEEGRVRVARAAAGAATGAASRSGFEPSGALPSADAIELGAGQQVASDATGRLGSIAQVASAGIAPWREGRISFQDTPLSAAIAEFERYGPTGLVIADPEVGALRLTGTFDPMRTGNFKLALPRVLPVQLRAQGDTVEIVRR
jgi:transmembrane sensor